MRRFGKYLLVSKISSGGMADVYRARVVGIRGFSKTVAIKRIYPHLLERHRFLRMFADEAKIASQLVHPNIVQILDLGEERGVPYIAMEYVSGRDLFRVIHRLLKKREHFPIAFATRVVVDLCRALHYAHEFGDADGRPQEIVHRDVSPRNILIGYGGDVKLTDFGVARARDREEHTEHGIIKGKVRYISPEGAAGKTVDRRSDIFSLGVVLAEMLTMRPLFDAPNQIAMLLAIREGRIDRSRLAGVPGTLMPVLDRALAADPAQRYPDARALSEDLICHSTAELLPMTAEVAGEFMRRLFADEIEREHRISQKVDLVLAEQRKADERPSGTLAPVRSPRSTPPLEASRMMEMPSTDDPAPAGVVSSPTFGTLSDAMRTPKVATLEGTLAETSLTHLIHRLATEKVTGRLDLRREPLEKSVFLELGDPVFVLSNVKPELFGEYLVARRILTRIEHSRALDLAASEGLRFTEALLTLEFFPPHEVYRYLAEQVRERIMELFTWGNGHFAFYPDVEPPELGVSLDLKANQLIHEGVHEHIPLAVVRRALEPHLNESVVRTGDASPEQLVLTGREQRTLRVIEAERPVLNQLVTREKGGGQVLRLVYLLHELGQATFDPMIASEDMA